MKLVLYCHLKTDNDGIRNAATKLIQSIESSEIWPSEYIYDDSEDDNDGVKLFICQVYFHEKEVRDNIANSMKGLAGIINACESGSFVMRYKSRHDEGLSSVPDCEIEDIVRKD